MNTTPGFNLDMWNKLLRYSIVRMAYDYDHVTDDDDDIIIDLHQGFF